MWEHTRDCHEGLVGGEEGTRNIKFRVSGKFTNGLYRQVNEDVLMQQFQKRGGSLLNLKYKYCMPKSVQPVFLQQQLVSLAQHIMDNYY